MNEKMHEVRDAELEKVSGGVQDGEAPEIKYFYADKYTCTMGERCHIRFSVSNADTIEIYMDKTMVIRTTANGDQEYSYKFGALGRHICRLVARNVIGDTETAAVIVVM